MSGRTPDTNTPDDAIGTQGQAPYTGRMTKTTSIHRITRSALLALISATVAVTGFLALGTGTASAGVTVKVHDRPAGNSAVVGWTNADCRTIGHSPRVYNGGGYWYKIGKDRWIFNAPKTPFCY